VLAGERDERLVAALVAAYAQEALGQNSAVEIAAQCGSGRLGVSDSLASAVAQGTAPLIGAGLLAWQDERLRRTEARRRLLIARLAQLDVASGPSATTTSLHARCPSHVS
jgi:hypothetical protein